MGLTNSSWAENMPAARQVEDQSSVSSILNAGPAGAGQSAADGMDATALGFFPVTFDLFKAKILCPLPLSLCVGLSFLSVHFFLFPVLPVSSLNFISILSILLLLGF